MFSVGTALVGLLYRLVITAAYWSPDFVRCTEPGMSIAIKSSRPLGGDSYNRPWCLNFVTIVDQFWQSRTVLYTSLDIFGHEYSRLSASYIRRSPRWPASVEWRAIWKTMERIDCGATLRTETFIYKCLTKSPPVSKLKNDLVIPLVGRILLQ